MTLTTLRTRGRAGWRWWLGLGVSAAVVLWLWRSFQWSQVFQALAVLEGWRLLVGVLLFTIALGTRAQAWRVLLGPDVAFSQAFWALMVGFLGTTVLPLRLGEAARVVALQRVTGMAWSRAVGSVALARLTDALLLGLLVVLLAPWALGERWVPARVWVVAGGAGALLALALAWALARARGSRARRAAGLPFVGRFLAGEALQTWGRTLQNPALWARFLGWKALTWSLLALEHTVLMRAWFPQADLRWGYWVVAVASLGVAVPSAPGHIGVVQAGILAALWPLGVEPHQALAFSLVKHAVYLGVTTSLGLVGLLYVVRRS